MNDEWARDEGSPSPLGAEWLDQEQAYNFALYSCEATAVTLLLYGKEEAANPMLILPFELPQNKTGGIWHMRIPAHIAGSARYYAYHVSGPNDPTRGLLFDGQKILLDPHATGVHFPSAFNRKAACRPGSNAGQAPLGVLPPREPAPAAPKRAMTRHGHDLVIYEMHIRGFTQRDNSGVSDGVRGTYLGVVQKIPYLKQLGITAVELMPIQQFDPQEGNYWGYMTLNFFAPHAGYSTDGTPEAAQREFRAMVNALHDADIEVFLDVVYNHTVEGGSGGPVYSYRGIDNRTYYALQSRDGFCYSNHSGCGNDLRTSHPLVRHLVVSSLHYWVDKMGVDGFRFDLASVFTRDNDGNLNLVDPPIIAEITASLPEIRLIAEPWSGDGSGYEIGRAFPGRSWRQWNDQFRNSVRRFLRGDENCIAPLMTRLYGSTDLFPDDVESSGRPYQSVNYVDCHDGLNLCDLLSYTNHDQQSWDCGHEGIRDTPADIQSMRRRQARNAISLLMLANGTPMFLAGDEFLHSQSGNANPYDQNNETTWLDWSRAREETDILRFFRMIIAYRAAHRSIGRSTGWGDDVSWYGPEGPPDLTPSSRSLAYHLRGATQGDDNLYVMINGWWEELHFAIQVPGEWRRVIDTALPAPEDIVPETEAPRLGRPGYMVAPRSVVVLSSAA